MSTHFADLGPIYDSPATTNLHSRCEQAIWGTNSAAVTPSGSPGRAVPISTNKTATAVSPAPVSQGSNLGPSYVGVICESVGALLFGAFICVTWLKWGKKLFYPAQADSHPNLPPSPLQ